MTISGYVYQAKGGESFDSVALAIYGDERYAAELLAANPEHSGRLVFRGGEVLALPSVAAEEGQDGSQSEKTAPWKE